jgi:hypothetical protein
MLKMHKILKILTYKVNSPYNIIKTGTTKKLLRVEESLRNKIHLSKNFLGRN